MQWTRSRLDINRTLGLPMWLAGVSVFNSESINLIYENVETHTNAFSSAWTERVVFSRKRLSCITTLWILITCFVVYKILVGAPTRSTNRVERYYLCTCTQSSYVVCYSYSTFMSLHIFIGVGVRSTIIFTSTHSTCTYLHPSRVLQYSTRVLMYE